MFPQSIPLIDDFERADGAANAGAGASLWTAQSLGGGSGNWAVVSNALAPQSAGANQLSAFDLPADHELIIELPSIGSAGAYIAVFFAIATATTADWEAYWVFYEPGSTFQLKRRLAGATSTLAGINVPSQMAELAPGDAIGVHRVDDAIKVRVRRSGAWEQAPVLQAADSSLHATGPIALEAAGAFTVDNISGGAAVAESDGGSGDPTEPVTIHVDADHPAANDTHTRLQASDPATPLKTLQAAALLAYATPDWADTIQIEPAANANAADAKDPAVYAGMHHRITGSDVLPFGDNTGNQPITVQGHVVSGQKPKVRGIDGRGLKNWVVQDLQQGYDVGSGDDNLTIGSLVDVADLAFRRVDYTGGGYDIAVGDNLLFEDCLIRSPYSPFQGSGNRYLDGVGFRISYIDNATGDEGVGKIEFRTCAFDEINGEDGIQVSLGGVGGDYAAGHLLVDRCVFTNIIGVEGKAHTDAIQILGGQLFEIRNSVFLNCDDAFIASDFHNGKIVFENNLVAYCGNPCSGQGTDEWIIRHNTIIHSFFGTGMSFGHRTDGVTQKITMVNNILDDYAIADDVDVHPDSVISHNIVLRAPGIDGNLPGVAEFGTSARMDPLPAFSSDWAGSPSKAYELANTPTPSPGIGQGVATDLLLDRLDRPFADPPDIGCHQSSPETAVAPVARAPYVTARSPHDAASDIDGRADVTITMHPKPGETIDATTITAASVYLTDPGGIPLPADLTVTDLAEDGTQTITLDVAGRLYPYVVYTAHLTTAIADTEGSHLATPLIWSFTVAGPSSPAVYPTGGPPAGWVVGTA